VAYRQLRDAQNTRELRGGADRRSQAEEADIMAGREAHTTHVQTETRGDAVSDSNGEHGPLLAKTPLFATLEAEELRELAAEAKSAGLPVVVWSYPRGSDLSKEGETAIDVVAYAAQIAAQLGADVIKVKLPSAKVELAEAQKVYQKYEIPISTLAERVHHVVQSSFDGRRIVIFSGGAYTADEEFFEEIRAIRDGGGFGSIIGRNSFQRNKQDALKFFDTIMGIYEGTIK